MKTTSTKQSTKPKTAKAKKPEAATKPKKPEATAKPPAKAKGKPKATPVESKATAPEAAVTAAVETTTPAPEATAPGKPETTPVDPSKRERLIDLDVPTLQSKYLDAVGRPTGSDNKAYLIWKIREAQKGRIPVGPRQSTRREGVVYQTLPLRMETDLVKRLDDVWRKRGLRSRMDLFRQSLHLYMNSVGEPDVAAMLTPGA